MIFKQIIGDCTPSVYKNTYREIPLNFDFDRNSSVLVKELLYIESHFN
jgi:hypothetical protein